MYSLLKDASQLKNPSPEQQQEISSRYDQIVAAGLNYHEALGPLKLNSRKRRTGHNWLCACSISKQNFALFVWLRCPFTNNQAERDCAWSNLNKSIWLLQDFEGAQIFMASDRLCQLFKQNKNVFKYLSDLFNNQLDLSSLVQVNS